MEYPSFLNKRIPPESANNYKIAYGLMGSMIKQNSIRTTEQLNRHILDEVENCRKWLAKNRSCSTINKHRRNMVQKLKYLMEVKGLVDKHLK